MYIVDVDKSTRIAAKYTDILSVTTVNSDFFVFL